MPMTKIRTDIQVNIMIPRADTHIYERDITTRVLDGLSVKIQHLMGIAGMLIVVVIL